MMKSVATNVASVIVIEKSINLWKIMANPAPRSACRAVKVITKIVIFLFLAK